MFLRNPQNQNFYTDILYQLFDCVHRTKGEHIKRVKRKLGMVRPQHSGRLRQKGCKFRPSLANFARPCIKNRKSKWTVDVTENCKAIIKARMNGNNEKSFRHKDRNYKKEPKKCGIEKCNN